MNDQEKILSFLKEIANQLGPAGEHAFKVVAARVFAEALIWVSVGITIIVISTIIGVILVILGHKAKYNGNDYQLGGVLALMGGWIIGLIIITPNAMDLASIEYATIARILTLVGH